MGLLDSDSLKYFYSLQCLSSATWLFSGALTRNEKILAYAYSHDGSILFVNSYAIIDFEKPVKAIISAFSHFYQDDYFKLENLLLVITIPSL